MAENHVPQFSSVRLGKLDADVESRLEGCSEDMLIEKDGVDSRGGEGEMTTGDEGAVILAVDAESVESVSESSLCSLGYGVCGGLWQMS